MSYLYTCTAKLGLLPLGALVGELVEKEMTVCVSVDFEEALDNRGDLTVDEWITINKVAPKIHEDAIDAFPTMAVVQATFGEIVFKG